MQKIPASTGSLLWQATVDGMMNLTRIIIAIAILPIIALHVSASNLQLDSPEECSILLTEVFYNALVENEYVVVMNLCSNTVDLSNWTLSDLEGILAFPLGTAVLAGQKIVIAQNSTMYSRDILVSADFQFAGGHAPAMIHIGGSFALNNQGDEVLLKDEKGVSLMSSYMGPRCILGRVGRAILPLHSIKDRSLRGAEVKGFPLTQTPQQIGMGLEGE